MKKIDIISVILFIIAIVVSILNPYGNLIELAENGMYILIMFIYFINIYVNERILKKSKQDNLKMLAENQLKIFYDKKTKILLVASLVVFKLIFGAIILGTTISKMLMPLIIFKNNFVIDNGMYLTILSIIVETLVVIVFTMKIINKNKGAYAICL